MRSSKESEESCELDVSALIDEVFTKDGAVVAVDPRRGFREKSFGIRTEEDASLRPATLDPDVCVLPWWCSWF